MVSVKERVDEDDGNNVTQRLLKKTAQKTKKPTTSQPKPEKAKVRVAMAPATKVRSIAANCDV